MILQEISRVERELTKKYRNLWDSPNVYTKHIGQEKEGFLRQCYCIFRLKHAPILGEATKIVQEKYILI